MSNQGKVLAVPGFGPVNSRPLLEWRQGLERKFVYDPNSPMQSTTQCWARYAPTRAQRAAQLRQQLTMGAKELWKAVHACEQMRKAPDPLLSRLEATRSSNQSGLCLPWHSAAAKTSTASAATKGRNPDCGSGFAARDNDARPYRGRGECYAHLSQLRNADGETNGSTWGAPGQQILGMLAVSRVQRDTARLAGIRLRAPVQGDGPSRNSTTSAMPDNGMLA